MQKSILFSVSFLILLSSCVTPRIHNALITENEATKSALSFQERKRIKLQSQLEEKEGKISDLKSKVINLRNDSVRNAILSVECNNPANGQLSWRTSAGERKETRQGKWNTKDVSAANVCACISNSPIAITHDKWKQRDRRGERKQEN